MMGEASCACTPEEAANVDLILRYRAAPATDRPSFFTDDYRRHRPGIVHLPELTGAYGTGMVHEDAFPDRADRIVDIVASGERVVAIWEVQGTHLGEFYGVAPTGASVSFYEIGVWRIANAKIAESWFLADETSLIMSLGILGPVPDH